MTDSVPEQLAKYVAALVQGTHEITGVTIKPKRTWVGLTNEEQQEVYDAWVQKDDGWGSFYALSEAKLKEKNAST